MQHYSYLYFYFCPANTYNPLQAFSEPSLIQSLPPYASLPTLSQQPQQYFSSNHFNIQAPPSVPNQKCVLSPTSSYSYSSPQTTRSCQTKKTQITTNQPPKPAQTLVVDRNVFKYPKKNAQSNLINQIVSFLSIPSKSNQILLQVLGNNIKVTAFYQVMRLLKRKSKKYINRAFLKDLLLMETPHIIHGILQKIRIEPLLQSDELRIALRKLVFYFLQEKCVMTILTSTKLDRFTFDEHLKRRRQVIKYLNYHLHINSPQYLQSPQHIP